MFQCFQLYELMILWDVEIAAMPPKKKFKNGEKKPKKTHTMFTLNAPGM